MADFKRRSEEKKEDLPSVSNGAPESKFQGEQQVAQSTGFKVESGNSKFVPEKKEATGSKLKQEVAASVIKDASMGGSLSGDGASFGGMRSSGSVGGVLGAANATPEAGKSRSDNRTSKKLDRNSTKLNFIPSDQVLVEWDESKPLADARDLDQGFNGTYRNEFARLQKNKEAVPGALMFDRSVDLLVKDNIYFGQGQKVVQSGVSANTDLKVTAYADPSTGILIYPQNDATENYVGGITDNYLCTDVDILLGKDGNPVYTVYNEEALTCSVDQHEANKSSAQNHILMNNAELVRETMDSKAGDEKADIWTPLARAVRKPTQVVGFLHDIEAGVGDEIATAYRKFSTSMSFQLNRAHKDGQDTKQPAVEALCGLNFNYISKEAAASGLGTEVSSTFHRDNYVRGDASTMIALYDSTAKYNTKADELIQPRSFRMHLQTADNNIDPFHTSKLFNQVYDVEEVFSTIDREYDPMAPICMSDKAAVIHRISWHKMGSYVNSHVTYGVKDFGSSSAADKFVLIPAKMANEVKSHGYNIYLRYPTETSGSIAITSNTNTYTVSSTFEFANGDNFEIIIASTDPSSVSGLSVVKLANNSIVADTDVLFDGRASSSHLFQVIGAEVEPDSEKIYCYQGGPLYYLYADLRNHYNVKVSHPLLEGFDAYLRESIGAKYYSIIAGKPTEKVKLPAVNISTIHSSMYFSLWSIMLCAASPWIVKARINSFRDILYYEKNVEYPFSSTLIPIKDVTTKSYSNFKYINYDTELECGRMSPATALSWMLPELYQQVGYASSESQVLMPWYTNQVEIRRLSGSYVFDDDASAMSFPSIRSGVRLAALDNLYGMTEKDVRLSIDKIASFKNLNPTLGSSHTYKYSAVGDGQLVLSVDPALMTAANILKLPRELGFFVTAPYGVLTPTYAHVRSLSTSVLGTSSFRAYYWFGPNAISTGDQGSEKILSAISINVNRAQNFTQTWYCVLASGTTPAVDHGFFLSAAQAFSAAGALLLGRTAFYPYASLADEVTGSYSTNMNKMRSLQKIFWTRIQKLPFIISPFDGIAIDNTDSPNSVILNDPYDFLYFFGLGGFRASDFRESVYNREKQVVNQGILFVADPWVSESPIFKEGSVTSGIKTSKGFEL